VTRRSSALVVPVRILAPQPFVGMRRSRRARDPEDVVRLSRGQAELLLYCRIRARRRAAQFTVAEAAGHLRSNPSQVSRGLDRLASFSLVGRQSVVGRGHRTRVWLPKKAARLRAWEAIKKRRAASASSFWARNVALSTPFGGFISREGLAAAWADGRPRLKRKPPGSALAPPQGGRAVRAGADPPKLLYGRCSRDGRVVRLTRFSYAVRSTSLSGEWRGVCRRHGELVVLPVSIDWTASSTEQRMAAIGAARERQAAADPETQARRWTMAQRLYQEGRISRDQLEGYRPPDDA
jgi:hypothetical protein